MSRDWVPFHASIREGAKRGIPRALRFIYLEVALLTRQYAGRLPLPVGFKTPEDALHDVLGGSFAEVRKALDVLTKPVDPDDETPMLRVEGERGRWILVVCAFDRWANADLSTDRVRRFREKQRQRSSPDSDTETRFETQDETDSKRLEKRRGEESREEKRADAPLPPGGGSRPVQSKLPIVEGKPSAASPDHGAVLGAYRECFKKTRGTSPAVTARMGSAAKRLVSELGAELAVAVIRSAFDDDWFVKRGCSFFEIANDPNRYLKAAPSAPPAQPRAPEAKPEEPKATPEEHAAAMARIAAVTGVDIFGEGDTP